MNSEFDAIVGGRIRAARQGVGLSSRDIAGRLGIEERQLLKIERGLASIPLDWLLPLSTILMQSLDKLLAMPEAAETRGSAYRLAAGGV